VHFGVEFRFIALFLAQAPSFQTHENIPLAKRFLEKNQSVFFAERREF